MMPERTDEPFDTTLVSKDLEQVHRIEEGLVYGERDRLRDTWHHFRDLVAKADAANRVHRAALIVPEFAQHADLLELRGSDHVRENLVFLRDSGPRIRCCPRS